MNTGPTRTTHPDVYPPGTAVTIGENRDIPAVIDAVMWRLHGVQYNIAWWSDGARCTDYLETSEFSIDASKKQFGFE